MHRPKIFEKYLKSLKGWSMHRPKIFEIFERLKYARAKNIFENISFKGWSMHWPKYLWKHIFQRLKYASSKNISFYTQANKSVSIHRLEGFKLNMHAQNYLRYLPRFPPEVPTYLPTYFEVLLGTLRHFLVLWGTLGYFKVLWGTSRYF